MFSIQYQGNRLLLESRVGERAPKAQKTCSPMRERRVEYHFQQASAESAKEAGARSEYLSSFQDFSRLRSFPGAYAPGYRSIAPSARLQLLIVITFQVVSLHFETVDLNSFLRASPGAPQSVVAGCSARAFPTDASPSRSSGPARRLSGRERARHSCARTSRRERRGPRQGRNASRLAPRSVR